MSLIKKPSELKVQTTIKALIYGQPGSGKTTFALSAPSPLLLDFDNGIHRVNPMHQSDTVQIESWQNMIDVLNNEDLSPFKTFVIDTAGKMLDYLGQWLIAKNPKLGKANGALSLQGYGERKAEFNAFLKRVSLMGKHLVFVAHDKEEREGDNKIIRPEIGGSSGNDLIKELDLVGYIEMLGRKRTISFDPCEKFYGKNTCRLDAVMEIVELKDGASNNALTGIFDSYQTSLQERVVIAGEYITLMELVRGQIAEAKNASDLNDQKTWAEGLQVIWDSKLQAAYIMRDRAKELGLTWNKEAGKYEAAKAVKEKKEVANAA